MMKKLLGVACVLAATPLAAQVPPTAPPGAAQGRPWGGMQARADVGPRIQQAFALVDTNHDGVIDQAEITALEAKLQVPVDGSAAGGNGRTRGMGRMGRMIAMADSDGDGRITLQEMTNLALRQFDLADLNHDGQVTPQERQAARAQVQGQQ